MIGSMVGTYKITEKIGEGGMGAVFRGIDVMLEREVAIKMLRPELASQPNLVERFRSEAVTLAKLNHPNIATLYSFLRQGDDFFMVMEFVRGETLDELITRTGAMNVHQAIHVFCQALEGIDHAHKMGIVHRDIKPANMMLTGTGSIKVMDFGIARVLGTNRITRTGHLIGTIEYMSPEQVRGEETDARSDIYSLGILLYEMLTGRLPFSASSEYELMRSQIEDAPKPPTEFAPHVPVSVEQAIMLALAKRPEARFQSAGEFRAVLAGSVGLNTNPGIGAPGGFVAPTTRLVEKPSATPGPVLASPTLTTGSAMPSISAAGSLGVGRAPSGHVSQQSVASPSAGAPVHPGFSQAAYNTPAQIPGYPQRKPSLLSALTWKHYAGAGAAVGSIIIAVIVVVFASGRGSNSQPPQQQQTPTSAGQIAPASEVTGTKDLPGLSAPIAPLPPDNASGSNAGGKPSRVRGGTPGSDTQEASATESGKRSETPETKTPPASGASPSDPNANHSASNKTPSTPRDQQTAKPADADKDKVDNTLTKIGGAVKKLGGIFGGKKKKDEKKP